MEMNTKMLAAVIGGVCLGISSTKLIDMIVGAQFGRTMPVFSILMMVVGFVSGTVAIMLAYRAENEHLSSSNPQNLNRPPDTQEKAGSV